METIDTLKVRRRELLSRRKHEQDLLAAGSGDHLTLFMVSEELMDVNAQLRALSPSRRVGGGSSPWAAERKQYEDWYREETSLDEEIDAGRAQMRQAAEKSLKRLSARQREVLELLRSGFSQVEISSRLNVSKSTVSRTVSRARRNAQREIKNVDVRARLQIETGTVDLAAPLAARTVLSAMTPKQAVCFYLYFSEWLTLREIGTLLGRDHSVISRTLHLALRNIESVLGGVSLENPEVLDELAYQVYRDMANHPELLPENVPKPLHYADLTLARHKRKRRNSPPASIQKLTLRVLGRWPRGKKPPGKLLTALRQEQSARSLFDRLEELFRRLKESVKHGKES